MVQRSTEMVRDEFRDIKKIIIYKNLSISLCSVQVKAGNHSGKEIIYLLNNDDFEHVSYGKLVRSTED